MSLPGAKNENFMLKLQIIHVGRRAYRKIQHNLINYTKKPLLKNDVQGKTHTT